MENSQIKKTYEDILRLKEQQPDSSQILKSVIQLKELVDNAIFLYSKICIENIGKSPQAIKKLIHNIGLRF